jgi:TetR/AcrR family transcriptional regulator, mexJK operon transcriptional repressor
MSDESETAGAARPRLEARRRALLDAAAKVFQEKGYAGATLDDVIAHSGGSRQTLYALFGGKQGLFEAIVAERSTSILGSFSAEPFGEHPPEQFLLRFGIRYLTIIMTPEAVALYRLVVAESGARKELGELFWRSGPATGRQLLSQYFEVWMGRGVLRIDDAERVASRFLGMLLGTMHVEMVMGLRGAPPPAEIEDSVKRTVKHFLDGCRATN